VKALAICGSFRDESNTNKLVKKIAESSGCDFELIYLGKLEIKSCTGCASCMMNEGRCAIDDDMQGLYEKPMNADALIVGSPIYYMDVSAAVKSLIDRSWHSIIGESGRNMLLAYLSWGIAHSLGKRVLR